MFHKFLIIAKRECRVRINKPAFWILSLLGPLVLMVMSVVPYSISSGLQEKKSLIINVSNELYDKFPLTIGGYETQVVAESSQEAHARYLGGEEQVLCDLSYTKDTVWNIYCKEALSLADSLSLFRTLGSISLIHPEKMITTRLFLNQENNEPPYSALQQTVALLAALVVYFFLFTYSVSLLKGVMEEKGNKVMDITLSSISPTTWITGKIVGVGLASTMQFMLWGIVSYVPFYFFKQRYGSALNLFSPENIHATLQHSSDKAQTLGWYEWVKVFDQVHWVSMFVVMVLCMIFGFILYATVFAIIGMLSARETDAQPYVLPITAPLLLSFFTSGLVIADPCGDTSTLLSCIPFTAPVILPLRAGLGVEMKSLFLGLFFLIVMSLTMVFIAGLVYKKTLNNGGRLFSYRTKR